MSESNIARRRDLQNRFDKHSIPEPNSGCQLWLGHVSTNGYPQMIVDGKTRRVNRLVLECKIGPLPAGIFACHKCDVKLCINEAHLFPGTHDDNMADMKAKGRSGKHGGLKTRLTAEQVASIISDPRRQLVIASEFGISRGYVSDLKSGRNKPNSLKENLQ